MNKGSYAQKAGIQEGDILIGGGGFKLYTGEKAVEALTERIRAGSTVTFRVRRAVFFYSQSKTEYTGVYESDTANIRVSFR